MTTTYKGLDYSHGLANIDNSTGIRYGVIPVDEIGGYWYEGAESYYINACPFCGKDLEGEFGSVEICPHCEHEFEEGDFDLCEPVSFYIDDEEYTAEQSADDTDIFIVKSKYYTYSQLCSPCAPGACHLGSPIDEQDPNNRCYCFGHDVFEDGKAPYTVYSVETNEIVEPE
jgi:hypothetical protein